MSSVEEVDQQQWGRAFVALLAQLDGAPFAVVDAVCRRARGQMVALEARSLAAEAGNDEARGRRLARSGGARSSRAARAVAGRAQAVAANPRLATEVAAGAMAPEQLDTIASAMRVDGDAATDQSLIDAVVSASVDQGAKVARDWLTQRANRAEVEARHDQQRRERRASSYVNKRSGLSAITLEGDDATIGEVWNMIRLRERQLYEADGGREAAGSAHARNWNQRLFDAAVDLVRGVGSGSGRGRPSVVLTVPIDGQVATAAGSGAVSDRVVRGALERAEVSVALVDAVSARSVALGRVRRNANVDQYLALVVRDEGCVLCGAHWLQCESHHVVPWNSPARGPTDLNNLALLCSRCHHEVHARRQTLQRDARGTWQTRIAEPHEVAPSQRTTDVARTRSGVGTARRNGPAQLAMSQRVAPGAVRRRSSNRRVRERSRASDDDDAAASAA